MLLNMCSAQMCAKATIIYLDSPFNIHVILILCKLYSLFFLLSFRWYEWLTEHDETIPTECPRWRIRWNDGRDERGKTITQDGEIGRTGGVEAGG